MSQGVVMHRKNEKKKCQKDTPVKKRTQWQGRKRIRKVLSEICSGVGGKG